MREEVPPVSVRNVILMHDESSSQLTLISSDYYTCLSIYRNRMVSSSCILGGEGEEEGQVHPS